jgi:hypothetical protein
LTLSASPTGRVSVHLGQAKELAQAVHALGGQHPVATLAATALDMLKLIFNCGAKPPRSFVKTVRPILPAIIRASSIRPLLDSE